MIPALARSARAFARAMTLFVLLPTLLAGGCAANSAGDLSEATRAYAAAEYGRSLLLSRTMADSLTGAARGQARYLEGLSLMKLERYEEAVAALESASSAPDRTLAARARVSLGTALIARGDFAAAAEAYRRASLLLDGEEKDRARSIEARCRAIAGRAPSAASAAVASAEPAAVVVEGPPERPVVRDSSGREANVVRFAIQCGAYRERSRAVEQSAKLRASVFARGLAAPRIIEKTLEDGSAVFAVQFGDFPDRAVAGAALLSFPKSGFTVERRLD